MEKREEKRVLTGEAEEETGIEGAPEEQTSEDPEEKRLTLQEEGRLLNQQVENEMQAYLEVLTGIEDPANIPSPGKFFDNPQKYIEQAEQNRTGVRKDDELDGIDLLRNKSNNQQAQLSAGEIAQRQAFVENPYNLPVIPEPQLPSKPPIRTLNDFDENIFEAPRRTVRMPRNIAPSMSAAGFPPFELLSIVPNRGVIGYSRGTEGVLLLGESIEGWELVAVHSSYAEFRNGGRKHVVSLDHLN